jgi:hypothetical protein
MDNVQEHNTCTDVPSSQNLDLIQWTLLNCDTSFFLGRNATESTWYVGHQPWMIDDEGGKVGGMRIGRRNRSIRWKPTLVPLCPPQIPHDLTWALTRAAAVGNPPELRHGPKLSHYLRSVTNSNRTDGLGTLCVGSLSKLHSYLLLL